MLGIVIVNYNSYENTFECVKSLYDHPVAYKHKIYVVDNGSTNDSYQKLVAHYEEYPAVEVLRIEDSRGYSAGLNHGMKKAIVDGCSFFLLCNNDLIFPKGAIDCLVQLNLNYPQAGVIGGRIVGINGEDQKSYKLREGFKEHLMLKKPFLYFKKKIEKLPLPSLFEYDGMVSGCCFLLSKDTIDNIGLLDEEIFLFYEEDALSYKLHNIDRKALLSSDIEIIHFGSTTIGSNSPTYYFNRYRSSMYVFRQYAHINNIQLTTLFVINYISLFIKSLKDKSYRTSMRDLHRYYLKLCQETLSNA